MPKSCRPTHRSPPDLEAAWDYVAANREEIEQAIRENEEGDDGPVG